MNGKTLCGEIYLFATPKSSFGGMGSQDTLLSSRGVYHVAATMDYSLTF